MKIRFCTKLITIILVVIFFTNLIFLANVKGRDNTTYIVSTNYYIGSYANDLLSKMPFWYRNIGYNVTTHSDPSISEFWEKLYADVQILNGHGQPGYYFTKNTGLIVGNGIDATENGNKMHLFGTNDVHWDADTDLVIYLACYTAQDLENGLARKTMDRGAENVIGWRRRIWADDANEWANYFSASIAAGIGVYDAVCKANSQSFPGTEDAEHSIKDNVVFNHGNANMKLGKFKGKSQAKVSNIKFNNVIEDERNILRNSNEIIKFDSLDKVIDIIKNYDLDYKDENYTIQKSEGMMSVNGITGEINQQEIIDLHFKLGEFYTNAGYVITISDGNVEAIYDNTLPLKNKKEQLKENDFIVDTSVKNKKNEYIQMAKIDALQKVDTSFALGYNIINQKQDYYYDVKTNKKYARVRSVVEIDLMNDKVEDYITTLFEIK